MKMPAGLTRDIKREAVKFSFDSGSNRSKNVAQFITLLQLCVKTVLVKAH